MKLKFSFAMQIRQNKQVEDKDINLEEETHKLAKREMNYVNRVELENITTGILIKLRTYIKIHFDKVYSDGMK